MLFSTLLKVHLLLSTAVIVLLVLLLAGRVDGGFTWQEEEAMFVRRADHYVVSNGLMPSGRFLAEKSPMGYRVFLLGGSQAMGSPFTMQQQGTGDEMMGWLDLPNEGGIATWLEPLLAHALAERDVEVVNAAMCGLGSSNALAAFRRIVEVGDPDLVILLSGNNERLDYADFSLPAGSDRSEVVGELTDHYRANIQAFADRANRDGIPLLLLTVPTNLRDWAPEDHLIFDVEQVDSLIEDGRHVACLDYLQQYDEEGNALLLYYRARCLDEIGDRDAARELYVRAKDLDRSLLRTRTSWNDILRSTPTTDYVRTLDLEQVVAEQARDGLPGGEEFFDYCHMKLHVNQHAGRILAENILEVSFPAVDRGSLDTALLPEFGAPQLKRLYWLKRIKWLRYRYRSAVPWIRDQNTARTLDSYKAELDDLDTRIGHFEYLVAPE